MFVLATLSKICGSKEEKKRKRQELGGGFAERDKVIHRKGKEVIGRWGNQSALYT